MLYSHHTKGMVYLNLEKPYNDIIQSYQHLFQYMNEQDNPESWNQDKMFWVSKLVSSLETLQKNNISLDEAIHYLHNATTQDANRFMNQQQSQKD